MHPCRRRPLRQAGAGITGATRYLVRRRSFCVAAGAHDALLCTSAPHPEQTKEAAPRPFPRAAQQTYRSDGDDTGFVTVGSHDRQRPIIFRFASARCRAWRRSAARIGFYRRFRMRGRGHWWRVDVCWKGEGWHRVFHLARHACAERGYGQGGSPFLARRHRVCVVGRRGSKHDTWGLHEVRGEKDTRPFRWKPAW